MSWSSLPAPEIYEMGASFWPWHMLLRKVADIVSRMAPSCGFVADYMCGTGALLEDIEARRPDLRVIGCDASEPFVAFARRKRPAIPICHQDVMRFEPQPRPDVVICTGGLHHLPEAEQVRLVERVSKQLPGGGLFLLGEEALGTFGSDDERFRAASALHREIRSHFSKVAAPAYVAKAAESVFYADLHRIGEYKRTGSSLLALVSASFEVEQTIHIWPVAQPYHGDLILLCRKVERSSNGLKAEGPPQP